MLTKIVSYWKKESAWSATRNKLSLLLYHDRHQNITTLLGGLRDAVVEFGPARVWAMVPPETIVYIWKTTRRRTADLLNDAQSNGWTDGISYIDQVAIVESWLKSSHSQPYLPDNVFDIHSKVVLEAVNKFKNANGDIEIEQIAQRFVIKAMLDIPKDTFSNAIRENSAHRQRVLECWLARDLNQVPSAKTTIDLTKMLDFFDASTVSSLMAETDHMVVGNNGKYQSDLNGTGISNVLDTIINIYKLDNRDPTYAYLRSLAAYKHIPNQEHRSSEKTNIEYSMSMADLSSLEQLMFLVGAEQYRSNIDLSKIVDHCNDDVKLLVSLDTHALLASSFGDPILDKTRFQELMNACQAILLSPRVEPTKEFDFAV